MVGPLQGRVDELQVRLAEVEAENRELRRRLGMHSGNSSRPPSSDGPDKAPPKSLRKRTGRRPGGQPGHEPGRLEQVADPDEVVVHRPGRCGGCAADLGPDAPVVGEAVTRQVFDLPADIAVVVTEHQLLKVACGCGHATRAQAPAQAAGPTNLGHGITAVAVYLATVQMIPVERVAATIQALFGIHVSTGWVSLATEDAEAAVKEANEQIKARIVAAWRAHFDESATKIAGKQHWFHTAATETLTAYHADSHGRGLEAIKAFGILPVFTGVAVHDAYSSYYSATFHVPDPEDPEAPGTPRFSHALCIAHVQRELRGLAEHDPAAAEEGWAAEGDALIEDLFRWRATWHNDGHDRLPGFKRAKAHRLWDALVERALATHPHIVGRPGGQTHARRLAVRLRDRREDYLRWLDNFALPATNNEAERTVRMIKTKTKVSGGFRTLPGLQRFLAIRGYIDTLRKNNRHIITDLRNALAGNAWVPT